MLICGGISVSSDGGSITISFYKEENEIVLNNLEDIISYTLNKKNSDKGTEKYRKWKHKIGTGGVCIAERWVEDEKELFKIIEPLIVYINNSDDVFKKWFSKQEDIQKIIKNYKQQNRIDNIDQII